MAANLATGGSLTQGHLALRRSLVRHGYRLTSARDAILRALAESGGHITADDLVALVHRDAAGVGRMTVYRTLDLLQQLGLVQPVYQGTGAAHYILLMNGHHHHLKCSTCDRIIEFDDCVVGDLIEALKQRFDFEIWGHVLEVHGLCSDCRQTREGS